MQIEAEAASQPHALSRPILAVLAGGLVLFAIVAMATQGGSVGSPARTPTNLDYHATRISDTLLRDVGAPLMCDPKWDHPDDCAALADLYEATNGKGWTFDGSQKNTNWATWNNGSSICGEDHSGNWFGIQCSMPNFFNPGKRLPCQDTVFCVPPVLPYQICPDNREHRIRPKHCRVSSIDLTGNNLVGTIPESVTKLPYLAELHLAFNKLTGAVPLSLDQNKYLTLLALNNNSLTSWGDGVHPDICSQFGDDPYNAKLSYCVVRDNPFKCPVPDCVKKQCDATCTDNSRIAP